MSNTEFPLHHFLYFSRLAPDQSPACVAAILRVSRVFNARHQLTGLLIFDGLNFCEYLEGASEPVMTLLDRIKRDVRHVDLDIRSCAAIPARLFDHWSMAYSHETHDDGGSVLDRLTGTQTHLLPERLKAVLPELDTETGW